MQSYDFRQKLRRYNILSQKCEVRRTELDIAYKKALKSSNDSISRLKTRNYSETATTTMTSTRLTTTTISPSKNFIMVSHHSPTKTSNSNISFNSPISGSPINRKSDKREENEISNDKKENLSDLIDDSQEIFSKNESNSKQNSADIEKEFQILVKQADDEEKEQKIKQEKDNQNAEEDEEGSDENEEDLNDENEVDFEFKEEETQNHEENGNSFSIEEEEQEDEKFFDVDEKNFDVEEENHEKVFDDDEIEEENHENILNDEQEEEENHEIVSNNDHHEEENHEKVLNDGEEENKDDVFEEEEEEEEIGIRFPDKNIIKAIANKVVSLEDYQINNHENDKDSIKSNEPVSKALDINNEDTLSNDDDN